MSIGTICGRTTICQFLELTKLLLDYFTIQVMWNHLPNNIKTLAILKCSKSLSKTGMVHNVNVHIVDLLMVLQTIPHNEI